MLRNYHSLIATVFLLALLAYAPPAWAQQDMNARYNTCTRQAASDAASAYKVARAWYAQDNSMAAQHCMALALFTLGNYAEAATILDAIISRVPASQGNLWLNMKAQAASAHASAGNKAQAMAHLDSALLWAVDKNLDVQMVPLLTQRAQLYAEQQEWLKALQDMDHALEIVPSIPALIQRAEIYLALGLKSPARTDMEQVLKQQPGNEKALHLLARTNE